MSTITLTIDGGVAEIALNRPEQRNALDREDLSLLGMAYREAEEAGVRALLLRGEGAVFCAGRDIAGVDPATDSVFGYLGDLERLMRQMAEFPAPTFAAVQGACLGVGFGLAIATDVVYIADDAKVGSPFAALGAVPDSGAHAIWYERIGAHRALDLIYTGELVTGAEAVAMGLFSRAVPADDLVDFTRERVARAASGPTQAFVWSKKIVNGLRDDVLWPVVAAETRSQERVRGTEDYREGFAAFQAKRAPDFTGR